MRAPSACYTPAVELTDVLVDARNVARSRWPNIPERELVERVQAWAAATGRRAVIVFDGDAPGVGARTAELDDGAILAGTGHGSADDRLIEEASSRRADGPSFWLVTSDRALRAAAGVGADHVVGGGAFLAELLGGRHS